MKKETQQNIKIKVDKILNDINQLDMEIAKANPQIRKVVEALEEIKNKLDGAIYYNPYEVMVMPPDFRDVMKKRHNK